MVNKRICSLFSLCRPLNFSGQLWNSILWKNGVTTCIEHSLLSSRTRSRWMAEGADSEPVTAPPPPPPRPTPYLHLSCWAGESRSLPKKKGREKLIHPSVYLWSRQNLGWRDREATAYMKIYTLLHSLRTFIECLCPVQPTMNLWPFITFNNTKLLFL